jgi:hypothetical protein
MPQAAKPKPREQLPPGFLQTAGDQQQFNEAAMQLGAELGWKGEPEWLTNDITVLDAVMYLRRKLHETFIAAAKGEEQPSHLDVCEHLAVDNDDEQAAVEAAFAEAFATGKGAELTAHKVVFASLGQANLVMPLTDKLPDLMTGKAAQ